MVILGTDIKINVHIEPINGYSMSAYSFDCTFYTDPNNRITINKEKMKKVNNDNYLALITGEEACVIGKGKVYMDVEAYIPDDDFLNGIRKEKAKVWTGITII